jgi:hypothetical protein
MSGFPRLDSSRKTTQNRRDECTRMQAAASTLQRPPQTNVCPCAGRAAFSRCPSAAIHCEFVDAAQSVAVEAVASSAGRHGAIRHTGVIDTQGQYCARVPQVRGSASRSVLLPTAECARFCVTLWPPLFSC